MSPAFLAAVFLCLGSPQADTLAPSRVSATQRLCPPVSAVSGETLRSSTSLADAVRTFSGVQIRDYGGAGGLKTINVRSLGSAHTAIFLDGLPIDNAQNMQPDLGRIDVEALESAELFVGGRQRLLQSAKEAGSASSLYLESAMPRSALFRLRLRGGAFGTVSPSLLWESRLGGRTGARITVGLDRADGRYSFHEKGAGYDTVMVRENGDLLALRSSAQFYFTPDGGSYNARISYYGSERGLPGPVFKQAGGYPHSLDRQSDRSFTVQGGGHQELGSGLSLLVKAKYAREGLTLLDVSEQDPGVSATWDYLLQTGYMSGALGWQPLRWLNLSAAADLQGETLRSRLPDASRLSFYGAASACFMPGRWKISASLQYMGSRGAGRYSFLSPSLTLDWGPSRGWDFGGLVKRSCRLPSFNDLYCTAAGARALLPEKVVQTSAWWMWNRTYGKWSFRAREELYFNHVTDKIVAVPGGSLFRWTMYNIGAVRIYGDDWDLQAEYRNGSSAFFRTRARYSYQWAHETDGTALDAPALGQIAYIPLHSATFELSGGKGAWGASAQLFVCSERFTSSSNRPDMRLAPWNCLDLTLSWKALSSLELRLEVKNLLNTQYQIIKQYPMPGTHAFAVLNYSF